MRFDTWLTLSGTQMDLRSISDPEVPDADFGGRIRAPVGFASYLDPEGRYLLTYPGRWSLLPGPPVEVRSPRLPLAVRVDLLGGPDAAWETVRDILVGSGSLLVEERRLPGPPRQLRGRRVSKDGLAEVHALILASGTFWVVLSTFLALPFPARLERYGRELLAAVRRGFGVPAPARPG